jgi:hypothetical protein
MVQLGNHRIASKFEPHRFDCIKEHLAVLDWQYQDRITCQVARWY